MERMLIVGGENLLDKSEKLARVLEESERELETRAKNEEQLRKELQEKEVRSTWFAAVIASSIRSPRLKRSMFKESTPR